MPHRVRLDLAYDGGGFEGWQVQPGKRTVQGELASVLAQVGESARPTGAGRTDAGVHALGQVAHVDLERRWDPGELLRAVRGLSPHDVDCIRVRPVAESFHARYAAETRTYHYALGLEHNLFFRNRRWVLGRIPDGLWAREELQDLMGRHDFAALAKSGGGASTTECRVLESTWSRYPGGAVLTLTADRFLYGMVRAVVGTLIRGSAQGQAPGLFSGILETRDRGAAGEAAPPWGLYLAGVRYPGEPDRVAGASEVATLAGLDRPVETDSPPENEP